MTGITLLAIGRPCYIQFAYNMALSIRFHSPEVKIQLLTEESLLDTLPDMHKIYFDIVTILKEEDYKKDGELFPALAKIRMYNYFAFDKTIYLDVDGVLLKPIDLFDQDSFYKSQVVGWGSKNDTEWEEMVWAYPVDIWEKYNLGDKKMPFLNSSFQYVKECAESEQLYNQAYKNLMNPLDVSLLRFSWGRNQPDELYMNLALCQLEINPEMTPKWPVYFSNRKVDKPDYLTEHHYILGLYGDSTHTHPSLLQYYNRLIHSYSKQLTGRNIEYKSHSLIRNKWMIKRGK